MACVQVVQALMQASREFDTMVDAQGMTAMDLATESDAADVLHFLKSI